MEWYNAPNTIKIINGKKYELLKEFDSGDIKEKEKFFIEYFKKRGYKYFTLHRLTGSDLTYGTIGFYGRKDEKDRPVRGKDFGGVF